MIPYTVFSVALIGSLFSASSRFSYAAEASGDGDQHPNCKFWAESGECKANPNYMLTSCKNACKAVEAAAALEAANMNSVPTSFYDIKEKDINGNIVDFSRFKNKVVYIVNVASYCGYTESNYRLLSNLANYASSGLEIIIFPCNQFGEQEPGTNSEISTFAAGKGFRGTIMAKGDVNGPKARPAFKFLKQATGRNYITW